MLFATYLAGAAGVIALHERLRAEFPRGVAVLASALVAGATSLFAIITTALPVAVAFALLAVTAMAGHRWAAGGDRRRRRTTLALAAIIAAVGLALGAIDPARAAWHDLLFAPAYGFLSLHQATYGALLGTLLYFRVDRTASAAAVAALAALAIAGAPSPLALTLILLAPGLAHLLDRLRARPAVAVASIVGAALLWNHWLMVQYTTGALPKDEPVSFAAMVRQQADVHTEPPYFYPWAFPMNVWFAWREDLPVDRYGILAAEPREPALDLVFDRRARRFLLDGWDAPGADPGEPSWWIGDARATLAVPLAPDPARPMRITVRARSRHEEPPVEAELALEINGHEIGRFVAPASAPAVAEFRLPPEAVGRVLRAGYNRVTLVSLGVRRVDPADPRPPGPLASRPDRRAWPVALYRLRLEPAP